MLEARIAPAAAVFNLSTLDGSNGFKLSGVAAGDYASIVSDAGDVNGDGFDDLIIGAYGADPNGSESGASYVVFGKGSSFVANLNLSTLNGSNGFKLSGATAGDYSGTSVSAAGDVNGDGFGDLIIGAPSPSSNYSSAGASYVVFGKAGSFAADVNLSALDGSNGFRLSGASAYDFSGSSVSAAGDVNGDGFDDLIIGARGVDANGVDSGASYVVFGKAGSFAADVSLSTLDGSNGFRLSGVAVNDASGEVSAAGDVNGDGFDDVIIGARGTDPAGQEFRASYVVFGKAGSFAADVNLSTLNGSNGFRLSTATAGDASDEVSAAGDVNGDGFDDVIIGARGADPNGVGSGASYVVFGKAGSFAADVNLSTLDGSNGFKLSGATAGDYSGTSVSTAGDVNGDGFEDLIIGAVGADPNGVDSGASYVVFGKASGFAADLNLSALDGSNGFKLPGVAAQDGSGASVSGGGDVNGDGFGDLIIGATFADPNGVDSGASYVVFGVADVAAGVRSVTVTDVDGDIVTVKVNKGSIPSNSITTGPNGELQRIDLRSVGGGLAGASFKIEVQQAGGGDGAVNVGAIDATGIKLAKVRVEGDLGQIDVGTGLGKALKSLTVNSLGVMGASTQIAGTDNPLLSEVRGALGKLTVTGDVQNAVVEVTGKLGKVTIGGNLIDNRPSTPLAVRPGSIDVFLNGGIPPVSSSEGGSIFAPTINSVTVMGDINGGEISAETQIKNVKIVGKLTSDDPLDPAIVRVGESIDKVIINGEVENALILAGYNRKLEPLNPDASIGKVVVKGNWIATSVVAGISDPGDNGFGIADALISGDTTPNRLAKIASVIIKGTATGSATLSDNSGITAQAIGKLRISDADVALTDGLDNISLDPLNQNFRAVEL